MTHRTITHLRHCPDCLQEKPETLTVFRGVHTRLSDWGTIWTMRGHQVEVCPDCYAERLRWRPLYQERDK